MPRRRKSLQADESILEESEPSGNISMTQEALTTLLTTLQQSQAEFCNQLLREVRSSTPHVSTDASTCAANAAMGVMRSTTANFSKCTSKFSGNPEESVENFIDAIEVYKSCLDISDANALLGMSMLLTSSAGTWWQGVKGTTKTWDEAITRLRSAYGDRRPPFRIYVELFSLSQGKENTDLFIAKVRALLAKLPQEDLCERVELDMAFGLLDRRIRKRIDRAEVSTFDELLKKARAVEDSLNESRAQKPSSGREECSRAAAAAAEPARASTSNHSSRSSTAVVGNRMSDSTTKKAGNSKLFCVYCKRNGHTKEKCEKLANSDKNISKSEDSKDIKCYGCGAANVIKSKCAKCNVNTGKNSEHSAFYSLNSARDYCAPTVRIKSSPTRPSRSGKRNETSAPPPQAPTPPLQGGVMFAGRANAPAPSCAESTSSHDVGGNPAYVTGGSITNKTSCNLTDNVNVTMDTYYSDNSVPYSKCLQKQVPCNSQSLYCNLNDHCGSQTMSFVNNDVNVISVPLYDSFCIDNRVCNTSMTPSSHFGNFYCVNKENVCLCIETCVCTKSTRCVCATCDQGEFASPSKSNNDKSGLRSIMFNGCQSLSGNSEGSKSNARDFMPNSRSVCDFNPFYNCANDSQHISDFASGRQHFSVENSDRQHFSVENMGSQHFSVNSSGSQHFSENTNEIDYCFKNVDCQQLCGITSGSQHFSGNPNEVQSFCRPVLKISILGEKGTAMVDSAAKCCVAGHTLYALLRAKDYPMSSRMENVKLADGKSRLLNVLTTEVNVTLEGRTSLVSYLIFPDADSNESLLGIDFLINFNISIDFGNAKWHFADSSEQFNLLFEKPAHHVESVPVSSILRDEEASQLSDEQREVLAKFLSENQDVFELRGEPTTFAEHVIDTGDHAPIAVPPYRLTPAKREVMHSEIEKMLADDIIEECESAWGSPALLVPKKNGQVRFCVDYRKLNAVTKTDVYPMPLIDELVQSTKRNCIMSTLDMRSGFWNVSVRECDRDKTAFLTPFGTYRFKRMPFGLKNAPSTFQRLIDKLRTGASLKNVTLLAYQDDLLVISESFDQHVADLRAVFERLRMFNLRANRDKCVFAREEVKYLGHVITQDGVSPDHDKVRAVADMKAPSTPRHLKTFLQTCSWFRKFILNFSEVAEPLTRLLKKNQTWVWGPEQNQAFQELKKRLTSAPILVQADYSKPFVLRTDASSYALGAVLLQGEGKDERPIEYASRLLNPAERNYSTTEREALAVVWSVDRFRGYIEGQPVIIGSDHQPLKWLLSLKSPSGRLVRWALRLQEFNIQFEYTPGRANVVADTLSRPTCEEDNKGQCGICSVIVDLPTRTPADLRQAQLDDPELKKIISGLESNDALDEKRWSERGYFMQQGVLYRYNPDVDVEESQLVVPVSLRLDILKECHDTPIAGHQGIDRTLHKLSQRFFFPGMRRFVADFIKSCATCQRYKSSNLKPSGLLQTPVLHQRGEVLAIDLFGPLPPGEKGEKYVLLVEDTATRWVELFALVDATSEACARTLIEEYFLRYGLPRRIVSDNGVQFVSAVMQQCMFILGIKQDLLPLYHPEANPAERKNRDLKVQLAQLVDTEHSSWPKHLPSVRFSMNSALCHTTGVSPAFLTFARDLRSPIDVHFDIRAVLQKDNFVPQITPYLQKFVDSLVSIRDKVEKEQDRRKDYADKGRKPEEFDIGDQVLVKSHVLSNAGKGLSAKFVPKRDGPYTILKKVSPTSYLVCELNAPDNVLGRFHASQLTRFVNRNDAPTFPIMPKRNRGRPRHIQPVSDVLERVPERGRFHEPEGECIADGRILSGRKGKGVPPRRYSPA